MESEQPTDDDGTDPLAQVARVIELAGLAMWAWLMWRMVRDDPNVVAFRSRMGAKVAEAQRRRRFRRVATVVPEATLILAEGR